MKVLIGDIFESEMKTLVNTVNCVGVMGKGIAQIVKAKYPKMSDDYAHRCAMKEVRLGEPYHYSDLTGISIINFPTKQHWRAATRLSDIEDGLDHLVAHVPTWKIESIAFPPLGCGNGGLEWAKVGPLMYSKLKDLDIPVEIYAPFGTPARELKVDFLDAAQQMDLLGKGRQRQKLRPEWIVLVEVLYKLEQQPHTNLVGREIFQAICYIMTKLGLDAGFHIERGIRGFFSSEVQEAINVLANNNWIIEQQLGRTTALKIGPRYAADRKKLRDRIRPFDAKIDKTVDLFSRVKSTEQADEITTVIFSVQNLKQERKSNDVSEQDLFDHMLSSKKISEDNELKQRRLAETIRNLEMLDWVKLRFSESLPVSS